MLNQKNEVWDGIVFLSSWIMQARSDGAHRDQHHRNYRIEDAYLFWAEWRLRHLEQIYNAWEIIEAKNLGELYRNAIKIDVDSIYSMADMDCSVESILPAAAAAILIC